MQINVMLHNKQITTLDVAATDTIRHVKAKLLEEDDIAKVMQRVIPEMLH